MRRLKIWYLASIFPEMLRLAQFLICGLIAAVVGGLVEIVKAVGLIDSSPFGIPPLVWAVAAFFLAIGVCLVLADATRLKRIKP